MRRGLLLFLFLTALRAPLSHAQTADEIIQDLSRITGLKPLRKVQQETMSRDQLKQYFEDRIREVVKPEEIRLEELALKKFGFVPKDFDLKSSVVDLMAEQAAAFYDYRKAKMVLLDGTNDAMQRIALVHELAHALADQHFKLEKYLKRANGSDDGALARQAVMEGQAQWLMTEYMLQKTGQSLLDSPALASMMTSTGGSSGGQFPVFDRVPLYLRESLLFPYAEGMKFQQEVALKMGKAAFAEVFRRPPDSSQEVLHPEQYLERRPAEALKLPESAALRGFKLLTEGTTGEFDHSILLKQYAPSFELLSRRWRAGSYRLYEHKKDRQRVALVYSSRWKTEADAKEFFSAYRKVLSGKWSRCEIRETAEDRFSGTGDDGLFEAWRSGDTVTSIEGLPEAKMKP